MPSIFTTTLAALAVAPLAMGHTWIEQLRNVNDKGEYVGEYGYPRGMVSKTDTGYTGDSMNWLLPVQPKVFIDETSPLCHTSQTKQEQSSDKYPRLQAVPGGFVAMRYMENGHVTMVDPATGLGKPEKGGTVFVYGTTSPKEDEKLVDVLRWTQNGTGGDARGVLLATNNFDDGRCYEVNDTPISQERRVSDPNFAMGQVSDGPGNYPLFCETNVKVPDNATEGKPYTFYWVWQWNTAPNVDPGLPTGKDQYYTTCIDVDVSSADTALAADAESKYALGPQQDAMSIAVSDFASRTAIMTNVLQGEVGSIFSGSATATGGAPAASGAPGNSSSPSKAPASATATAPALTEVTNIPTMTTRPGSAKPTSGAGDSVTVTDIVYVTVTAGSSGKASATASPSASAPASMVTSVSASASASASAVTSAAASGTAASSGLGGFTIPSGAAKREIQRKNGAKFRGMFSN